MFEVGEAAGVEEGFVDGLAGAGAVHAFAEGAGFVEDAGGTGELDEVKECFLAVFGGVGGAVAEVMADVVGVFVGDEQIGEGVEIVLDSVFEDAGGDAAAFGGEGVGGGAFLLEDDVEDDAVVACVDVVSVGFPS